MSGGAISPGQKWLNRLPVASPSNLIVGRGIFTGTVNGVENLVVDILVENSQYSLRVLRDGDNTGHWAYDANSNDFYVNLRPSDTWSDKVIIAAGLEGVVTVAGAPLVSEIVRSDVIYKLLPSV